MSQISFGTITIVDTNDIQRFYVEYAKSNSSVAAPTTGWSQNRPTWQNGTYVWQRTVIKKQDVVQLEYGNPVCITGEKGQTGQQGIQGNTGNGISSIVTTYCNYGTGTPTASYSGWSSNVPEYDSTKPNYWVKTTVNYTSGNPSVTIYKDLGITEAAEKANLAVTTAQTANTNSIEAISIAGSKNKIYYSDSFPTGGTYINGDTLFKQSNAGTVMYVYDDTYTDSTTGHWKQQQFEENAISDLAITNAKIKDLHGDKITANTIAGNKIVSHDITAVQLATNAIKSTNYQAGTAPFSNRGTFLDLSNGNMYSPVFGVNATENNQGAFIKGSVQAYDGRIGQNQLNYWYIGNYYDYNQLKSAYIKGNGTATIQLGDTSTWRLNTNRIHTAWNENKQGGDDYKLHYPVYNSKYWDMGLHVPTSKTDKFIYIRNSSSSTSLTNLQNNINDQTNGTNNYWNYQFYITSEGILSAKSLKTINNTFEVTDGGSLYARNIYIKDQNGALTQIGGTDAAYLSKTGGIITGDLTVGNATPGDDQQYNGNLRVIGDFLNRSGNNITLQTNLASTAAAALTGNSTSPISIGVTGTLPTSNGGTGNTSYNAGGVVYADGSSPKKLLSTAAGTSGYLLKSGGTGAPTWVDPGTLTVAAATKATQDGDGNVIKTTYLKLTGGNVTGPVNFGDSVSIDDLNAGSLIVTGNASFTNNINANTINNVEVGSNPKFTDTITTITTEGSGNAITAIEATNGALKAIKGSNFLMGITSQNVINALGYTPYNAATNPSGYTTNTGTVTSVRVQASSPLQSSVSSAQSSSLNTTISFINQNANVVLAGPSSGNAAAPTFRALVAADIPSLTKSKISDFPTSLKNPNSLSIKIFNGSSTATTTTYDGSVSNQSINVAGTNAITSINSTTDGKLQLTLADGSKPDPISIKITATTSDSASMANKLNLSQNVGSTSKPVYFDANTGLPKEISYTIQSNVPQNAVFTDTKYSAGTGLNLNGTTFNHSNSITAGTVGSSSATSSTDRTIVIPYITYDAQGHIIASGTHTHTLDSFPEAYLTWGGRNLSGSYAPTDAAMIPELGANRFAFLKPTGIEIEYSIDGGENWSDYEATDLGKTSLFSTSSNLLLGKATVKANNNVNNMLRITITTNLASVYTTLNKIAIYMNTAGNTVWVKIERATKAAPTDYITHLDWTRISGWPGWNILNISELTTYGNSSSQNQKVRFVFKQTAINTNYPSAGILSIFGFGGVGWTTPSTMAKTGHLYAYDGNQNATFPAQVTATQFNGPSTELINKTLDSLTLNSTEGSFTFQGNGAPWDGTDWVGLQVGSSSDKFQIHASNRTTLEYRQNDSGGTNSNWGDWQSLLSSGNYTDYTVTKTGSGATGTWGISISGNAATATNAIKATQDAAGNDIQSTYLPKTTVATGTQYLQAEYKDNGIALGPSGLMRIPAVTYNAATPGYTSGGETFYKAAIKYIAQNYSTAGNLIGTFTPNSQGPFIGHIYNNKEQDANTGLPRYSTFIFHNLNAGLQSFGTYNYNYYYKQYVYNSGTWDISISGTAAKATADKNGNDITTKYVTIDTTQTVSGRKTFSDLAAVTFKPSSGTDKCNINYNATLGALVFSF